MEQGESDSFCAGDVLARARVRARCRSLVVLSSANVRALRMSRATRQQTSLRAAAHRRRAFELTLLVVPRLSPHSVAADQHPHSDTHARPARDGSQDCIVLSDCTFKVHNIPRPGGILG